MLTENTKATPITRATVTVIMLIIEIILVSIKTEMIMAMTETMILSMMTEEAIKVTMTILKRWRNRP